MRKIATAAFAGAMMLWGAKGICQSQPDALDSLLGAAPAPGDTAAAPAPSATPAPPAEAAAAPATPPASLSAPAPSQPVADASPGPAATAHPRGISSIEEIVVTAQKKEESINDVPLSVSAFSGDDLKTLGVSDTRDLGNILPGFTYGDSGYGVPIYSIRGIGFNDPSESASSTVGIYDDEFNLPYPIFSKGGNLDLQRVEVLKGPQGTLYGRNTTGGLVNYIANKPTDSFQAGGSLSYARFGVLDGEGYASGPLTSTVRARVAYRGTFSGEGWQYSNTRPGDTLGRQDKQSARMIFDWKPAEHITTSLTLSGWSDRSEPQAPQAIALAPQNPIAGALALSPEVAGYPLIPFGSKNSRIADWSPDLDFHLAEKFAMAGWRTDWSVSDAAQLSFLASYENFDINHSFLPQTGLNSNNTEREMVDHTNADEFELRLSGDPSESIHYLAGLYLSHDRVNDFNRIFVDSNSAVYPLPLAGNVIAQVQPFLSLLGLTGPLPTVGDLLTNRVDATGTQVADTHALFANGDWKFLPDWKLTLGMRYTEEKRDFLGCTRDDTTQSSGIGFAHAFDAIQVAQAVLHGKLPPTMLAQPGGCIEYDPNTFNSVPYTGTLKEPNLSYRSALDWTPVEDWLFYASYSRGFKSGSFPIVAASTNAQYVPVVEEKLDAYELGGKTAFFDRRLNVDSAVFYYGYRNKQLYGVIYDQIFGPLPVLVNAPTSTVEGFELDLKSSPIDGLFLALNGLYLRTVLGPYVGLDTRGNPQDLTGKPFNFAPRVSTTFIANYTVPVSETRTLGLGGDFSYRSGTNSVLTQDPLFAIPGYRQLNLHMDYTSDQGWALTLFVRNVLNEFYTVGTINTGDTVARFAGMPRTYGLRLSYNYR
jgi:outer membrane receptor protein involved in Fe transport